MADSKGKKEGATTAVNTDTGEIATVNPQTFINKQAQGLGDYVPDSLEELMALSEGLEGGVLEFQGSPWEIVKKEELLGKGFVIADVRHYEGKFGDAVAVMAMTLDDGRKIVFNDGSTGVYQQVVGMVQRSGRKSGIVCKNGLRKSEYTTTITDPFGNEPDKEVEGVTYYVA